MQHVLLFLMDMCVCKVDENIADSAFLNSVGVLVTYICFGYGNVDYECGN